MGFKRVVPWLECLAPNAPAEQFYWTGATENETCKQYIVRCIRKWTAKFGNQGEFAVTTRVENDYQLYPYLKTFWPDDDDITFYGGYSMILGQRDDPFDLSPFARLTLELKALRGRSTEWRLGHMQFVDMEWLLRQWYDGNLGKPIPLDNVRSAAEWFRIAEHMGSPVVWNHPMPLGDSTSFPARLEVSMGVVQAFAANLPASHVLQTNAFAYPDIDYEAYGAMVRCVGEDRVVKRLQVTESGVVNGRRCWKPDEFKEFVDQEEINDERSMIVLYTGAAEFLKVVDAL